MCVDSPKHIPSQKPVIDNEGRLTTLVSRGGATDNNKRRTTMHLREPQVSRHARQRSCTRPIPGHVLRFGLGRYAASFTRSALSTLSALPLVRHETARLLASKLESYSRGWRVAALQQRYVIVHPAADFLFLEFVLCLDSPCTILNCFFVFFKMSTIYRARLQPCQLISSGFSCLLFLTSILPIVSTHCI